MSGRTTLTIVLAAFIAIPLGVFAAYRQGSWLDRIVMGFSVLGFSVPVFGFGYLLIYVFAIQLGWFPVQGYQRLSQGFGGWLHRLILPALTLSVIYVALIARMTRTSVLEVMNEPTWSSTWPWTSPTPSLTRGSAIDDRRRVFRS